MKNKKEKVLLFLPIFVLLLWVVFVQQVVSLNPRARIPVRGYDPRDILAGRYLRIQTDYSDFQTQCVAPKREKTSSRRASKRTQALREAQAARLQARKNARNSRNVRDAQNEPTSLTPSTEPIAQDNAPEEISSKPVNSRTKMEAFFCVDEQKIYVEKRPETCEVFVKGMCRYGRFTDSVSRFYVPELDALALEKRLRDREIKTEVELSLSKEGRAIPVDLFFNGVSYKEFLK